MRDLIDFDYPTATGGGSGFNLPPLPPKFMPPNHGSGSQQPAQPAQRPPSAVADKSPAVIAVRATAKRSHKLSLLSRRYAKHRLAGELSLWRKGFTQWQQAQAQADVPNPAAAQADAPKLIARPWQAWQEGRELKFQYITTENAAID